MSGTSTLCQAHRRSLAAVRKAAQQQHQQHQQHQQQTAVRAANTAASAAPATYFYPASRPSTLACPSSRRPARSVLLFASAAPPPFSAPPATASSYSPTLFSSQQLRAMSSTATLQKSLTIDNINPHVKAARYAVRGELAVKSEEYRAQLDAGNKDLPFDTIISANIGNPQQLDQKPLTFFRQVASILENPALLEKEDVLVSALDYKKDVFARARKLLKFVGSVGAYSASQGAMGIREEVAKFIERRDGHSADPSNIFLSNGASAGVNALLSIICATPETGVLVPIPQYPLYTATLSVLNARCVPYYLDEQRAWGTSIDDIRTAYETAQANGTDTRAIVMINPGNPTGASLERKDIESVLRFAAEKKLVVMADEVYQTNVFKGEFHSFKKILRDLQKSEPGTFDHLELASLHSVSKGMIGECGHRGGYYEMVGFDEKVKAEVYKYVSIQLCPPVIGQCFVEMMVNPPKEGEESYPLYRKEYDGIFKGLLERATALYEAFKKMEGVECQIPAGSMYLFPTITLPAKAIEAARKQNKQPDEFYTLRMLDATGVCTVPGSGFGQKDGSWHFRTTFLAPGTEWTGRLVEFHNGFMREFA